MIILRPIRHTDEQQFIELAFIAHTGITTLPKDASLLKEIIDQAAGSFQKTVSEPSDEHYIFVAEDTAEKKIIGISAVAAVTGANGPLYFYRIEKTRSTSAIKAVPREIAYLAPLSYVRGPSEVCSLFLHPDFRKTGIGKLLSLGRFLFIAAFRKRFTNSIFAELRGVNTDDISPFWDATGRHFLNVSFKEALDMLSRGKEFIAEFLPKYPIYIPLLAPEVQAVIGQTHEKTRAALAILQKEGFRQTDEIDIFDAGPKVRAMTDDIRTIKTSRLYTVEEIRNDIDSDKLYLIANERLEFRALIAKASLTGTGIALARATQQLLEVELHDVIRLAEI